jgi:hypothetical protein
LTLAAYRRLSFCAGRMARMEANLRVIECSFGPPLWVTATVYVLPLAFLLISSFRRHRFSLRGLFVLIAVYAAIAAAWPPL